MHIAVKNNNLELFRLGTERGVDVNAKDGYGKTALHIAAQIGRSLMVYDLVKHGADVNAKDKYEKTALDYAVEGGHRTMVQWLKKQGAKE